MSKILFISCHAVLEREELALLTELGHDVFSLHGAYENPEGHPGLPRPSIPGMKYHENWAEEGKTFPRTEIPDSFLKHFDCIIVMHTPAILINNWSRMKHKKVIWRSIGQSTTGVEQCLAPLRNDGMKIIRMSPKEINIPKYIGADAMIRFYKDEEELGKWNGEDKRVINFTQSLKGRRLFCHYDHVVELMSGFDGSKVYGTGNEDLGPLNGGELTWDFMKGKLRDTRVFAYGGTWPSPYTLAFQEAFMTGIPVIAIGKRLAQELPGVEHLDFYEIEDFIQNGVNGFVADDISTLRGNIYQLLNDDALAKSISEKARETAIQLFGKQTIKEQWKKFLEEL